MKQSFFSQFFDRLTSETPIFFKKIVIFCISLTGTGLMILGFNNLHIPQTDIVIHLPDFLVKVAGYMIAAGTIAGGVAKSATTNPDLQAKGGSNVVVNAEETPPVSTEANKSPKL